MYHLLNSLMDMIQHINIKNYLLNNVFIRNIQHNKYHLQYK